MAVSNFGPIESQSKQIIFNCYKYFELELTKNLNLPYTAAQLVEKATGVCLSTVYNIVTESNSEKFATTKKFTSPKNKKLRPCPSSAVDDFDQEVIRRTIYNFHLSHKQFPTLKGLHSVLKSDIDYKFGISTLRKQIQKLGFKWKKTEDNRKILMEKHNIRLLRINYLTKIAEYRSQDRPLVYTDETYIHTSHVSGEAWTDGTEFGVKKQISTGQRLIIVHAGGKDGFIPNALLMFKANQKTGDYHDQMNFVNYEKWLKEKLIPNLKPNSVLIVDNASYHNKLLNRAPTSNSNKQEMMDWLTEHNISYNRLMYKTSLYELIKQNKERFREYHIDAILKEHGHSVLRLPPYHPTFNPIENIWSMVKGYVAKRNVSLNMQGIMSLATERMNTITAEDWENICHHVESEENKYRCQEGEMDQITDNFIINTCDSSDDEHDSE
ncbi:uncharacterized protein LOC134804684 [Cydia splendana]|uniref:uncharacterized protein LOC134804684 n=1 Tax=Cydia splendana TaxID=1100963 RepID=UPI00300CB529